MRSFDRLAGGCAVGAALATGAWFAAGPLGVDAAAHLFQTAVYGQRGFELWSNYWYAGRYQFVAYSLVYYPLASLVGVVAAAIASAAVICGLSALVMRREWGDAARWPAAALVPVTTLMLMSSGAFPFAAGLAAACVAIERAGAGRRGTAAVAAAASVAFSPLAGLLLATLLAAALFGRPGVRRRLVSQRRLAAGIAAALATGAVLQRAFPSGGRYPFAAADVLVVLGFCLLGLWLCRGAARARPLAALFAAYLAINLAAFAAPGPLGSNTTRLFTTAGGPLILLAAIIGRPHRRLLVVPLVMAVFAVQLGPALRNASWTSADPAAVPAFWAPVERFLAEHSDGQHRVEVVATAGHWESFYLADRRVPLTRGWFRQDDFPQNDVLYAQLLSAGAYRRWLHRLGVEYVLLPSARLDYSSQAEARLLRSGTSGLRLAARLPGWTVYRLRRPTPLVTRRGGGRATVTTLGASQIIFWAAAPGIYDVRVRYSPYWAVPHGACVRPGPAGMTQVEVAAPGLVRLAIDLSLSAIADQTVGVGSPVAACVPA